MTIPAGDLQRGKRQPAKGIGRQHQQGANQRAAAQQRYLAAAQHETRHMRRHQAHKTQAADAGDAGRGQQHRGEKAQHRQLLQTYAEADGGPVAQQRHVRRPGGTEQDDGPGQRPAKATASSGQVAACRLPASQIIAVCTSRTSAVVAKDADRGRQAPGDADAN